MPTLRLVPMALPWGSLSACGSHPGDIYVEGGLLPPEVFRLREAELETQK